MGVTGAPATAPRPEPVSGDDVRTAAAWLAEILTAVDPGDASAFDVPAGPVRWTCWATAEHVIDDLLAYALQLAGLPHLGYLPLCGPRGEDEVAHVPREAGATGLAEVLTAGAELLATQVEARPTHVRAFHPYGLSDPEGFAAMGAIEVLVHGQDIALGLTGERPSFPPGLAARVVARLFPEAPDGPADDVLVWCTGRGTLPGLPRQTRWRWDSTVRA